MTDTRALMDVHTFFGLSHASYAFIPQVLADQMPAAWARDFTRLRHQLRDAFAHLQPPVPGRYVGVRATQMTYEVLSENEMDRLGVKMTWSEDIDGDQDPEEIFYIHKGESFGGRDYLMVPDEGAEPIPGFGFHRTLLQSMPMEWQYAFVALLNEAFEEPGARELYAEHKITPQNLIEGQWRDVAETIPDYRRGRTRLTPRLETS